MVHNRKTKAVPTDPATYARIKENVQRHTSRWPNAYASGQVVQKYKHAMMQKGVPPYVGRKPDVKVGLARWYREDWRDLSTGKPCGEAKSTTYYPTCRPQHRVTHRSPVAIPELSKHQKAAMVQAKQKAKTATVSYKQTQAVRAQK